MQRLFRSTVLMLALGCVAQAHEWTDVTGQQKAQATYVSSDTQYVYVRLADARSARVARDRLSEGDRVYVAQLEQRPAADAMPPAPDGPQAAESLPMPPTATDKAAVDPNQIRYVYRTCGTAQHLAGRHGTTVYYGPEGFVVAALEYAFSTPGYFIYRVNESNCGEYWAFPRFCTPCCGYEVLRWYRTTPGGTLSWKKWRCEERFKGVPPKCL